MSELVQQHENLMRKRREFMNEGMEPPRALYLEINRLARVITESEWALRESQKLKSKAVEVLAKGSEKRKQELLEKLAAQAQKAKS